MISKLRKKAQGLPLNTVVLAILVILVLVIIIVYFTTSMSKTGDDIEKNTNDVNACEVGSYLIPADKYDQTYYTEQGVSCVDEGGNEDWVRILGANTGDENNPVCCALKK